MICTRRQRQRIRVIAGQSGVFPFRIGIHFGLPLIGQPAAGRRHCKGDCRPNRCCNILRVTCDRKASLFQRALNIDVFIRLFSLTGFLVLSITHTSCFICRCGYIPTICTLSHFRYRLYIHDEMCNIQRLFFQFVSWLNHSEFCCFGSLFRLFVCHRFRCCGRLFRFFVHHGFRCCGRLFRFFVHHGFLCFGSLFRLFVRHGFRCFGSLFRLFVCRRFCCCRSLFRLFVCHRFRCCRSLFGLFVRHRFRCCGSLFRFFVHHRLFYCSKTHRIEFCAAARYAIFMLFVIVISCFIFTQIGQSSILDIERFFLALDICADADDIVSGKLTFAGDPICCIHHCLAVHSAIGFLQLLVFKDFAGGQIRQTCLESFCLFLNFFHFGNRFGFDDRRYILCGLCSCFLRNNIAFRLALFRDDGLCSRIGSLSGDRLSAIRRSRIFLFLNDGSGFFLLLNDRSGFFILLDDRSRLFLLLRSRSRLFLLLRGRSRFFLLFGSWSRSRLFLHFSGRSGLFDGDFFHCCRFFDDGLFPFGKHADRNGSKQHRHGKQQA